MGTYRGEEALKDVSRFFSPVGQSWILIDEYYYAQDIRHKTKFSNVIKIIENRILSPFHAL